MAHGYINHGEHIAFDKFSKMFGKEREERDSSSLTIEEQEEEFLRKQMEEKIKKERIDEKKIKKTRYIQDCPDFKR